MKPLIDFGTEEQKRRLLPRIAEGGLASLCITEPHAGSDATGMRTRFTPDGDAIRIDGGKTFITNGSVADRYLLFGKWSEIEDPRRAISAVVVESGTPGLSVVRTEDKMGIRASPTATLAFEDCRVPRANLLVLATTASAAPTHPMTSNVEASATANGGVVSFCAARRGEVGADASTAAMPKSKIMPQTNAAPSALMEGSCEIGAARYRP
jgi:alkylation response protein AidB-like acyl-CoA dehydrogenase